MNRKTRAAALAAATITALAPTLATVPAQADDADWIKSECINYDGSVKTCLYVGWSKQGDGSGVRLESLRLTTPEGCGALSNPKYQNMDVYWWNPRNGNTVAHWTPDDHSGDCSWRREDYNEPGSDKYSMLLDFYVMTDPFFGDRTNNHLFWQIEVKPDGDFTWHQSFHSD